MPTQSIPLTCPACGGGCIEFRQGKPPRCMNPRCRRDIPLGPPAPTEADRLRAEVAALRDLLRRAVPLLRHYAGPVYDIAPARWLADAEAATEDKPCA